MIVSFSKKMEYCGGKTLKYLIENGLYKLVRIEFKINISLTPNNNDNNHETNIN